MYTKNIVELEEAFNRIAKKWEVNVIYGITNSRFKLEDGLPWMEVEGNSTKTLLKSLFKNWQASLILKCFLIDLKIAVQMWFMVCLM